MSAILKFDFKKKKQIITFFGSKLSKLHKTYTLLHVTTTFPLKHEETRTNSVPNPHPLTVRLNVNFDTSNTQYHGLSLYVSLRVNLAISS